MLNIINKKRLEKLIEPHFHQDLKFDDFELHTIVASNLLTSGRFDLAFKLFYLEMRDRDIGFAQAIYKENISANGLGKYFESGNKIKNSFDDFLRSFDDIYNSILDLNKKNKLKIQVLQVI